MSTAARRYYLRGRHSFELGELDQAIESLASAIDLAPHFVDARLAYAAALCRLGDVPRAAQTLRAGLGHARTEPARAALWLTLGEVLTTGGDFVAAEDALDQAALHPAYATRAAAGKARLYGKSGRSGDAIASLLRAVGRVALVLFALALGLPATACKDDDKPAPRPTPVAAPPPPPPKPLDTADFWAGQPPPSVTPERKALAENVLVHMEAIAAAGDANHADCKVAAAAMKVAMERAHGDIAEMEKLKNQAPDRAARHWFEKAYGHRMVIIMQKVITVANQCKEDPDFQVAIANSPFAKPPGTGTPIPATVAAPAR